MARASQTLVVAGTSARWLAESAVQGGWSVVALDLFGDLDTRRVAQRWAPIGSATTLAIDPGRLRDALAEALADGACAWLPAGGFEGHADLLDAGGALPCLGMGRGEVAAVRDPVRFFAGLDWLGLRHPPTQTEPPAAPRGWLAKRAGGTGGWHIRRADDGHAPAPDTYYQRAQPGEPMSALFLADGQRASLVALNRLLVRRHGAHPHVYHGAIGPIHHPALQRRVEGALDAIVPAFGLRGLASLDFVAEDERPWLLEVNPRPSASMALHGGAFPGGLLRAHAAALAGEPLAEPHHPGGARGSEIVFARRACHVDAALCDTLVSLGHCHDLPGAGSRFATGDPVCSVSAAAGGPAAVETLLSERRAAIESRLLDQTFE